MAPTRGTRSLRVDTETNAEKEVEAGPTQPCATHTEPCRTAAVFHHELPHFEVLLVDPQFSLEGPLLILEISEWELLV